MKVELHDYNIGTQSGDATVLVYDDFGYIIFDGTVNFEFTVEKFKTGREWIDFFGILKTIKITDMEFFDTENRRIKPKYEIKEAIEYNLIEQIKDKENE